MYIEGVLMNISFTAPTPKPKASTCDKTVLSKAEPKRPSMKLCNGAQR